MLTTDYECDDDGRYGLNCDKFCPTCLAHSPAGCYVATGGCVQDCDQGYMGYQCEQGE